jgi:hypothetical protein
VILVILILLQLENVLLVIHLQFGIQKHLLASDVLEDKHLTLKLKHVFAQRLHPISMELNALNALMLNQFGTVKLV